MAGKTPEETLQDMVQDFDQRTAHGTVHPGQDLQKLLDSTPGLKQDVLDAISQDKLRRIDSLNEPNALGVYMGATRMIQISPNELHVARTDPQMANSVRFTLGHEVKHAADRATIMRSDGTLEQQVNAVLDSPGPVHDYTQAIKAFDQMSRTLEVDAEITGFNTVATQLLKDQPKATLRDVYNASPNDMASYIDVGGTPANPTYAAKPGLALDGLKMPMNDANRQAIGKLFYEDRTYPQRNVSSLLDYIGSAETQRNASLGSSQPTPEIRVDLNALGVRQADVSTGTHFTNASAATTPASHPRSEAMQAPQHPLYQQALQGLEQTQAGAGMQQGELQRTAAALAAKAQQDGLPRVDQVVQSNDGRLLFAVSGTFGAPDAQRSHIDRAQAAQQPMEQSLQALAPEAPVREQDAQKHAPLTR